MYSCCASGFTRERNTVTIIIALLRRISPRRANATDNFASWQTVPLRPHHGGRFLLGAERSTSGAGRLRPVRCSDGLGGASEGLRAHFELRTGCHEALAGITRTSLMRTRSLEPSASIAQISAVPRRLVSNSSLVPSGDQTGLSLDAGAGALVSCVLLRPSWSMTQIWP